MVVLKCFQNCNHIHSQKYIFDTNFITLQPRHIGPKQAIQILYVVCVLCVQNCEMHLTEWRRKKQYSKNCASNPHTHTNTHWRTLANRIIGQNLCFACIKFDYDCFATWNEMQSVFPARIFRVVGYFPLIHLLLYVAVCLCCHWTFCKLQHPIKNWVEFCYSPKMFIIDSKAQTHTHIHLWRHLKSVLNELNKMHFQWNEMWIFVFIKRHIWWLKCAGDTARWMCVSNSIWKWVILWVTNGFCVRCTGTHIYTQCMVAYFIALSVNLMYIYKSVQCIRTHTQNPFRTK